MRGYLAEQVFCFRQDLVEPMRVNLKQCPSGEVCSTELNRCRRDGLEQQSKRLPGSTCLMDSNCLSGYCHFEQQPFVQRYLVSYQSGVCAKRVSLVEIASCSGHEDCKIGSFCEDHQCKPLRQLGESCSEMFECA